MAVCHDIDTIWIIGIKWQIHCEMFIAENNAFLLFQFILQGITEQAGTVLFVVFLCTAGLHLNPLWNKGIAVHLTMRVRHGNTNNITAVFKRENVLDFLICRHLAEALAPEVNQLAHMAVRKLRQRSGVSGGIQNDFTFAVIRCRFKEIRCHIIGSRRVLRERRKIVVILHYFVVWHITETWAERTVILGHLRAVLPVACNHVPVL